MAQKDFYLILGVNKASSADEIKKAYRKLALKFHPDKNPGDKRAEEKFKEATEAYEILSDPKRKQMYDQFGFTGGSQQQGFQQGGAGFGGFQQDQAESFQDIFGDIFGDVFGGQQKSNFRSRRPKKGSDLRYTLNLSFEDAATGCEKTISFIRQRSGRDETTKLAVKVPAGVRQGQRLKLAGEGDKEIDGALPGDLFVIINLMEHSIFRRDEDDLILDLPLSYVDAILGTNIEIPTLTNKVSLKIPQGTHSGQIFRIKGKGFSKVGGYGVGDMLVKVIIDTPDTLNSAQKELLDQLAKNTSETPQVKAFREKVENLYKGKK